MSIASPAQSLPSLPQNLDLPALAASLQTALDALVPCLPADAGSAPVKTVSDETGQIRTYRVPPYALKDEQEYLEQFRAANSFELMTQVLDRLSVTVILMEQFEAGLELPDNFLPELGGQFRDSLEVLERIASFLEEMERVPAAS